MAGHSKAEIVSALKAAFANKQLNAPYAKQETGDRRKHPSRPPEGLTTAKPLRNNGDRDNPPTEFAYVERAGFLVKRHSGRARQATRD